MAETKTNKIYKIFFIVLILVLIGIAAYGYTSNSLPKHKRDTQVVQYKQELFKSLDCEYNCPLSLQQYQNKTQLLPTTQCIKDCTTDFKTKWGKFNATKEELSTDNFIIDLSKIVEDCKKEGLNTTTFKMNNTIFFDCTKNRLETIKTQYDYLKN